MGNARWDDRAYESYADTTNYRSMSRHNMFSSRLSESLDPRNVKVGKGDRVGQQLRESIQQLDMSQQGSSHWQADDQIHGMFARASGNEMLAETIAHLRVLCRLFEVVDPFNRIEEDRAEQLAILDAYGAGDALRAEQAVVNHLRNLGRYTLSRLSNGLVMDFSQV